jgi:putative acetyltransferase
LPQQGVGKSLFTAFLSEVDENWTEVGRIELESRSTNHRSVGLYKSLGFVQEGRMINKTRNINGRYEDSLLFARTKLTFSFL